MTTWEYATVPLITHATKQILDQWGADGWELVQIVPGPAGTENLPQAPHQLVATLSASATT